MIPQRLIEAKRDGHALSKGDLTAFLTDYHEGRIPDHQMSAFLMAVLFRGMSPSELDTLLDVMADSGRRLDFSDLSDHVVDKHSTGGVGDKVSLVVAPLVASLGALVPMMSGRGLGHTGGTLDKLSAIPDFRTTLSLAEFRSLVERVGCAMVGQSDEIAPLDRRLYALRDQTGAVPSPPLMVASILSKKLAEGIGALVLDVKVGSGAFVSEPDDARALAELLVRTAESRGVRAVARLTAMDRPLGRAIGNALEVAEALDTLSGKGPADVRAVSLELAVEMLLGCGLHRDRDVAMTEAARALDTGHAREVFSRMVEAQGGRPDSLDRPERFRKAAVTQPVWASSEGVVSRVDPRALGWGVVELGGGRRAMTDSIDTSVGFELLVTVGDEVVVGQDVGFVYAADEDGAAVGSRVLEGALTLAEAPAPTLPLFLDRFSGV